MTRHKRHQFYTKQGVKTWWSVAKYQKAVPIQGNILQQAFIRLILFFGAILINLFLSLNKNAPIFTSTDIFCQIAGLNLRDQLLYTYQIYINQTINY
ncbi:hypothetical protein [Pontibacter sp. 13R65]|uniref:hypothetical protein n=1 Tax=Pontibacter sp. 13R65 TaxID=3127458 RepID=UPI00301CEADD